MNAAALVDALDAIPAVEVCDCGRPRHEHVFWNDRIYDIQGLDCPSGHGREYRFNQMMSAAKHREARIALVETVMAVATVGQRGNDVRTSTRDKSLSSTDLEQT